MRRTEGSRLLLAHPRVRIMALCKVPKNTVSQWCSGTRIPCMEHRVTLVALDIPLRAWDYEPRRMPPARAIGGKVTVDAAHAPVRGEIEPPAHGGGDVNGRGLGRVDGLRTFESLGSRVVNTASERRAHACSR